MVQRIITQQSTKIDAVSRATQSSRAIMTAVQSAFDKAGKYSRWSYLDL
ncbi:MAG: FMN-binding protein [Deltaproteobacteria bacterium]|nr:FMN-binding protein [Deltaproteobacteria bacterium]